MEFNHETVAQSKPYTNLDMYNDIKNMLEEVNNPKDDQTRRLLEIAAVEFKKADQSGSDKCVDHFINKYPLLAQNCPKIFREALLVNRNIDLNMVRKALTYQEKIERKQITIEQASEKFGVELANKFFPEAARVEMGDALNDPEKRQAARQKVQDAIQNEHKQVIKKQIKLRKN
jgi:hypothetical protein